MASIDDILKRSKTKKAKKISTSFSPQCRRAYDYLNQGLAPQEPTEKSELNSNDLAYAVEDRNIDQLATSLDNASSNALFNDNDKLEPDLHQTGTETSTKPTPNLHQTSTDTSTKPTPNWHQTSTDTSTKPIPSWHQTDTLTDTQNEKLAPILAPNWHQTTTDTNTFTDTIIDTKTSTNRKETSTHKALTMEQQLLRLSGLKLAAMRLIISDLKLTCSPINKTTIFVGCLAKKLNTSTGTTRNTLRKLEIEEKFIKRLKGVEGKNGYSVFQVPIDVAQKCMSIFNDPPCSINSLDEGGFTKLTGTYIDINTSTNTSTDTSTMHPYNSSSINNNITTKNKLSPEWESLDFSSLDHIGFGYDQLETLQNFNLPEIVQQSIEAFAHGLKYNSKVQGYDDPLNVLMGVLRKGKKWNEPGFKYVSPKQRALEELAKQKKEEAERILELQKELEDAEFTIWIEKMPQNELMQLKESISQEESLRALKGEGREAVIRVKLRDHFRKTRNTESTNF